MKVVRSEFVKGSPELQAQWRGFVEAVKGAAQEFVIDFIVPYLYVEQLKLGKKEAYNALYKWYPKGELDKEKNKGKQVLSHPMEDKDGNIGWLVEELRA